MRVGVIGPQYPDSFADNIASCLPELGVEPVRLGTPRRRTRFSQLNGAIDIASRLSPNLDHRLQRRLSERAASSECDLVIVIDQQLHPWIVRRIRSSGTKVVFWFPDALSNLDRQLMFVAGYDHLFFKDPVLVDRVRDVLGLPVSYLPEACNPKWHRPSGPYGDAGGVVVAGNLYPTRLRLLDRLHQDGVRLSLHAPHLPRSAPRRGVLSEPLRPYLARDEKARVFRSASAVLNNLHPSELSGMNCRLFEAAGSGAVVLTEDRTSLRELFEPEVEVLTFRTYDQLLLQARRAINEPDFARSVADAAASRAHAEHTYAHRIDMILNVAG